MQNQEQLPALQQTCIDDDGAKAEAEFAVAFDELCLNDRPINWKYWVHQMPTLTAGQAARLMSGLDPDMFEDLCLQANKPGLYDACHKAKMIERLAEAESILPQSPSEWFEWAVSRQIKVTFSFADEINQLTQNIAQGSPSRPLEKPPTPQEAPPQEASPEEAPPQEAPSPLAIPASFPQKACRKPDGGDSLTPLIWKVCDQLSESGTRVTARPVMAELKALADAVNKTHPLVGSTRGGVNFEYEKGDQRELNSGQLTGRIKFWKKAKTGN